MGNKEIRDILLGRVVRQDERFWMAAPSDAKFHFHGVKDGAGDVRLFGVTHLSRRYQIVEAEPEFAFAAAGTALNSMGRPMQLESIPEAKACLYAPNWIAPVLLTVEQEGFGLQITAYTGRSPLVSRARCRIAMWMLERRLPEDVVRGGKGARPDRNEVKQQKAVREKPVKKAPAKEETVKRGAKRVASPKKKKAAPKRLKK